MSKTDMSPSSIHRSHTHTWEFFRNAEVQLPRAPSHLRGGSNSPTDESREKRHSGELNRTMGPPPMVTHRHYTGGSAHRLSELFGIKNRWTNILSARPLLYNI